MATYEFNDQIKFLLPSGFMLTREENDDGEEVVKIISGNMKTMMEKPATSSVVM